MRDGRVFQLDAGAEGGPGDSGDRSSPSPGRQTSAPDQTAPLTSAQTGQEEAERRRRSGGTHLNLVVVADPRQPEALQHIDLVCSRNTGREGGEAEKKRHSFSRETKNGQKRRGGRDRSAVSEAGVRRQSRFQSSGRPIENQIFTPQAQNKEAEKAEGEKSGRNRSRYVPKQRDKSGED